MNVIAQADSTDRIFARCDPVSLARRYRWRVMVLGADSDYRLVASPSDPMSRIPAGAPGRQMQIIVRAVDGNL